MKLSDSLVNFLNSKPTISSLLNRRIYDGMAPTSAQYPFVVYELIGYNPTHSLDGPSEFANTTYQVDVLSNSTEDLENVSEALRNVLDGFNGLMGVIRIQFIKLESIVDTSALESRAGSQNIVRRRTIDFAIGLEESKPTGG